MRLLLGLLALVGLARAWLNKLLPVTRGRLTVEGLTEPVEILRDDHGVVHIEATSLSDAVFAQGFVQAQDRLWQMELNRRVGRGQLAALLGNRAVETDRFLRRLGLAEAAQADVEAQDEAERELLEAYVSGVNAGIRALGPWLPVEFWLLWFRPQAWTRLDTLVWIQVMAMDLCSNWEQELLRGRILEKVGAEEAARLHQEEAKAFVSLPPGAHRTLESLADFYHQARQFLPQGSLPGASNAWVVSGQRSATGEPLLASDPHLVGRLPSIWHEVHLEAPGLDVFGVTFAGVPLVVIGHSDRVAWGITNAFADVQDLYLEKLEGNRYLTERGWKTLQFREERIEVRGGERVIEQVALTRHGPLLERDQSFGLALRWTAYEPSHPVATLRAMNQASSAELFKEALAGWHTPAINVLFGDVEGNIGMVMAGAVPIRNRGTGLTPVPGWTGDYQWTGLIPTAEMPTSLNPECGYLVNANNPVVDESYGHFLSHDFMGSARAHRIEQLLRESDSHTVDDFATFQCDLYSGPGARFALRCQGLETSRPDLVELLGRWDGHLGPESVAGALYQVMVLRLLKSWLEPKLGRQLTAQFLGQANNPLSVMAGHTGRYTGWLLDRLEQEPRSDWDPRLEAAFEETVAELTERFGSDARDWRWGRLHQLQFRHPLGELPVIGRFFQGPIIEMGGDTDTPLQTAVIAHRPFGASAWCPSWRQVANLADLGASRTVLPTGQSGHPASPHYLDQFPLWRAGQLKSHQTGEGSKFRLEPKSEPDHRTTDTL